MEPESVRLTAADGYGLAATLYDGAPGAEPARAAVLCCGGGIPARVYRRFAAWLGGRGLPLLAFDYRGIGGSRPAERRGFDAAIEDWADDAGAAIAWLRGRYPRAELCGIAHSIGGLILASAPGAAQLGRFLLIGVHTGYCGDYHPRWRGPMTLMWHGVMPALARVLGYFPGRALRLGEDLPGGFAGQWGRRRRPRLAIDTARTAACLARAAELRGRALALTFTDDGFATPRGTRRLLEYLPRLAVEHRVIAPREAGLRAIGHFGFFRPGAEATLWPPAATWLTAEAT